MSANNNPGSNAEEGRTVKVLLADNNERIFKNAVFDLEASGTLKVWTLDAEGKRKLQAAYTAGRHMGAEYMD